MDGLRIELDFFNVEVVAHCDMISTFVDVPYGLKGLRQACLKVSKVSTFRIVPAMMTLRLERRSNSIRMVATNAIHAVLS